MCSQDANGHSGDPDRGIKPDSFGQAGFSYWEGEKIKRKTEKEAEKDLTLLLPRRECRQGKSSPAGCPAVRDEGLGTGSW